MMNFASDNVMGASAPVLRALVAANEGPMPAYGADEIARRVERRLCEIFERDAAVILVATGTAANALAVATMVPPYGHLVCHHEAHVIDDECGAPEFFAHGAKLIGLPGTGAKLEPATLDSYLAGLTTHVKQMPARGLSISQVTECGLVYRPEEIARLSSIAHARGLKVHMDGARFANALVALGCAPAEMTWKAGVDILTFGATKNGCLAAEAIVVFDPALAESLDHRRKRSGHTLSKGRLLSAQLQGYLAEDHWLENARHANAMASRLVDGLARAPDIRLAFEVQANEVFAILPRSADVRLKAEGAVYHPWSTLSLPPDVEIGAEEVLVRLVTSFATTIEAVDRFTAVARSPARAAAE